MINEFLKSRAGVVLLSIIWGLGLATLFKKSCDNGPNCQVIEYRGPTAKEAEGVWNYGNNNKCYRLQPFLVSCRNKKLIG